MGNWSRFCANSARQCGLSVASLTWETGQGLMQNSARECGLSAASLTWETGQDFVQTSAGQWLAKGQVTSTNTQMFQGPITLPEL